MRWRRCDPVQIVRALLLCGHNPVDALQAISQRRSVYNDLKISIGTQWLVIQGAEDPDNSAQVLLPVVSDGVPLYEAVRGFYCPVGYELDEPAALHEGLFNELLHRGGLSGPLALMPPENDRLFLQVYELHRARPLGMIDFERVQANAGS